MKTQTKLKDKPSLSFTLLGKSVDRVFPYLGDFKETYYKSRRKLYFRAYIASMAFTVLLVAALSFTIPFILGLIIAPYALLLILGVAAGISIIAGVITFLAFYLRIQIAVGSRATSIELYLPYALSYMSILANAGNPPHEIFASLAGAKLIKEVANECKDIVRDLSLLGKNMSEALRAASSRSPSKSFSEFLDGYLYTIRSGGDINKFLITEANEQMRIHKTKLRTLTESLSTWAETYVIMLVAFPLIITVMLGVVMVLGGNLGGANPLTLFQVITYVMLPSLTVLMLVILSAVIPEG
jgi:archaeal flagellar protein FlaJ